jgi:hypothetical protein
VDEEVSRDRQHVTEKRNWTAFCPKRKHVYSEPPYKASSHPLYFVEVEFVYKKASGFAQTFKALSTQNTNGTVNVPG